MPIRPHCCWWWIVGLAVALNAPATPLHAAETTSTTVTPQIAWSGLGDLPDQASPELFDRILTELRGVEAEQDPRIAGLVRDLEAYRQHRLDDARVRDEATGKALDVMAEKRDSGALKDALAAAIEASSQTEDQQALLADPGVQTLIEQAEHAAVKATAQGDWLEVMSLYRYLNYLFEPQAPYRDPYELAESRVRILGLYAPEKLREMQRRRQRIEAGKSPDAEPAEGDAESDGHEIDAEPWQEVLKGVELVILTEAISSARNHVTSPETRQLLLGAIDRLLLVIDVEGLGAEFPALDDPAKVQSFRAFLRGKRREIEQAHFGHFRNPTHRLLQSVLEYSHDHDLLPRNVLVFEMTQGALGTLDKFSEVIWPYRTEGLERSTQGEFTGVGIQIRMSKDDRITVMTPIRNTPAFHAGVRANDIIAQVEGQKTDGWSLDKAVHIITGAPGTTVTIGLERPGQDELVTVNLIREVVPIESVSGWELEPDNEWDYYIDQPNRIGYIRLSQFVPQSADDMDVAVEKMRGTAGLDGLILDLRFNPGGLLRQAVEVANRFIPDGTIVSTVNAERQQRTKLTAWPGKAYGNLEVVVLINQTSASASEIVAGAVQDYGRATIVGERSYGKGSVQDVYEIAGARAYLKLTTQYYMLPMKRIIHRESNSTTWGIEPDWLVPTTDQQAADAIVQRRSADVLYPMGDPAVDPATHPKAQDILDKGVDPQLETALLMLKTRLLADRIRLAQSRQPERTP